jgi:hypothetical protein
MMIGRLLYFSMDLTFLRNSIPDNFGIFQSRSTKSTGCIPNCRIASSPFSASTNAQDICMLVKTPFTVFRMILESSTTMIVIAIFTSKRVWILSITQK